VPEAETHPLLRPPDVDSLPEPSVPNPLAVPKAHHDLQNLCPTCRYHPSYIYSHLHLEKTLDDELAYYERCGDKEMYEDTLSNDPVAQTRLKAFSHSLGIASNCMPAGSTFAQTVPFTQLFGGQGVKVHEDQVPSRPKEKRGKDYVARKGVRGVKRGTKGDKGRDIRRDRRRDGRRDCIEGMRLLRSAPP